MPESEIRVLVSTSTFPRDENDSCPRFVLDLCQSLTSKCRLTALVPDAPHCKRHGSLEGVEVRRFTYFWPRSLQRLAYGSGMPDNLRSSWLAVLQLPLFLFAQAFAILRLQRKENVQLVHSHWIVPQGLSAALVRFFGRRKFQHVATLHSGDAYFLRRVPGGRFLARWILSQTDAVFAVSSTVRKVLDELLGHPSEAKVLPVGVSPALFTQRAEDAAPSPFDGGYLLFVGRLIELKGVQYLLRSLPAVLAHHPNIGLVIVGDGNYRAELESLTGQLGLADSVRFLGALPQREVVPYLCGCRLLIVPSLSEPNGRTEGTPAVILEGLAAGARVAASAVGGIPEILRSGVDGWLFRERDPQDMERQILRALQAPAAGPTVSRQRVEDLAWPKIADSYLETYGRLVENQP